MLVYLPHRHMASETLGSPGSQGVADEAISDYLTTSPLQTRARVPWAHSARLRSGEGAEPCQGTPRAWEPFVHGVTDRESQREREDGAREEKWQEGRERVQGPRTILRRVIYYRYRITSS